jgi:ABC-type glucose/galactose transport system permease subunit
MVQIKQLLKDIIKDNLLTVILINGITTFFMIFLLFAKSETNPYVTTIGTILVNFGIIALLFGFYGVSAIYKYNQIIPFYNKLIPENQDYLNKINFSIDIFWKFIVTSLFLNILNVHFNNGIIYNISQFICDWAILSIIQTQRYFYKFNKNIDSEFLNQIK